MFDKPPTCAGCPAEHIGRSYVLGVGPIGAPLLVVGQGPGEQEARKGIPFIGPLGTKLDHWFYRPNVGLQRKSMRIDNIVRCWLPKNRPPTPAESTFCMRQHLWPDIRLMDSLKGVVAVGVHASRALANSKVGERAAGSLLEMEVPDDAQRT